MYAIYVYIDPPNHPNVGIYGIHGVSGIYVNFEGPPQTMPHVLLKARCFGSQRPPKTPYQALPGPFVRWLLDTPWRVRVSTGA